MFIDKCICLSFVYVSSMVGVAVPAMVWMVLRCKSLRNQAAAFSVKVKSYIYIIVNFLKGLNRTELKDESIDVLGRTTFAELVL